ncbi:MAG: hypothetical protein JO020_30260 [Chloroflexi bacterium]|nr:hypothetical protein [Chloroflexota bacterium]MBV9898458.1 hypothetical protein [Chloroflexota bacterium]
MIERAVVAGSSIHGYRVADVVLRTWIAVTQGGGVATATLSAPTITTATGYQVDVTS